MRQIQIYIKQELASLDSDAKKVDYLNFLMQYIDKQRQILMSKNSAEYVEVIEQTTEPSVEPPEQKEEDSVDE